ncbi:MAG: prepilin-type N-terminal cleavage/methylation domain-containing protein [Chitinispirillales bacterium]|jgi:prepilin-type N-terminal cleavage/methylation domain-containing protein|nr:prepilin-type N-terminal cleavage/methylation domain-containing protein [Chitinispirillales bacterium]
MERNQHPQIKSGWTIYLCKDNPRGCPIIIIEADKRVRPTIRNNADIAQQGQAQHLPPNTKKETAVQTKKSQKNGFTLVEVIVVAVIVLILSAVAIPMYNGYVRQARQDTAQNLAETAAAAANTIWRRIGTPPGDGTVTPNDPAKLNIHFDAAAHEVNITGINITVTDLRDNSIKATVPYMNN